MARNAHAEQVGPGGESSRGEAQAPEGPTDLRGRGWFGALKRTGNEFQEDKLAHWAAALTYYAVLSIFPALLALVSILGLIGTSATQPLIDNLGQMAPGPARDILTSALQNVQGGSGGAGIAFIIGLAAAVWAASKYINGFMDASNSVWDAPEGRPIWLKLPVRFGITLLMLVLLAVSAVAVVFTGPLAQRAGDVVGLGDTAVTIWSIAKWPVLIVLVSCMIAVLYWAAPNVKQPGFRWATPGGLLAVLLWIVVSLLFAYYVANFSSFPATYGAFAGVAIFLIWLWLTNLAILLGAEFNAELERGRQIEGGHPADSEPFLPLRHDPS